MRNGGGGAAAAAATPVAGLSVAPWRLAQMGKASRWLRNLFLPGWKSRKAKDRGATDADCQSVLSAPLPTATPAGREKRRWSFRRLGAGASGGAQGQGPLASSSSHCFSEAEVHVVVVAQEQDQDQQQQVPDETLSTAGTVVVPLPASSGRRSSAGARDRDGVAAVAAVKIQTAFRSYLARKALCALRGMVRLQAIVRGQLVRRQANLTLRRMQALVHAQRRARAERLRLLDVEDGASSRHQANATATPRPPPSRRSPQHPARPRKAPEAAERGSEEHDVRIVEVDDGAARASALRNSSFCHHYSTSATTPSRITPGKPEDPCQKVSPTTPSSARTDASGRFDVDDASFSSASEPTPVPPGRRRAWRPDPQSFPSYMANTESSRAKARSQSAPRQRLSSASETTTAAASPSPSCWERPSSRGGGGGGVPRRASLDPMDLPGGGAPPSRRVERCASRARVSMTISSVPGSECGSSSTIGHRGKSRMGHSHGTSDY